MTAHRFTRTPSARHALSALFLTIATLGLSACGGGGGGARVTADTQTLNFTSTATTLSIGQSVTVSAQASSGLAPSYASLTPTVCTVDSASGGVQVLAGGTCTLTADQSGNEAWAPASTATLSFTVIVDPQQTLTFSAAPNLTQGGTATVQAKATSGLAVVYSSLTPAVCTVDSATGSVTDLTLGNCVIAADQAGDTTYRAATQVQQTLTVQAAASLTVPAAPGGVSVTLGDNVRTVVVNATSVNSGGSPVTRWIVESVPTGISAEATRTPVQVPCPSTCAGRAFTVRAANALGTGAASTATDIVTAFKVVTVFREPDTQPNDTLFTGTFTLNSTTGAVSGLTGQLTESMTGNAQGTAPYFDMTQVALTFQLQTWRDTTLGGTYAASFAKNTTSTFTTIGGGDGWSPLAGVNNGGIYTGFPATNAIQNSSVLIFVPEDPFAALTQAQIDKLAYADCAPGGMMGAVCMTGTSAAGYGSAGTMSGYPVSQQITKQ